MEPTLEPRVTCVCGIEVHDTEEARRGHHATWHTDEYLAECGPAALRPVQLEEKPEITITHTRAEGTLLDGSRRGDGVWEIVHPLGVRSSKEVGLYLPRSRDKRANTWLIRRIQEVLEAAGYPVTVEIDEYTRRSFAEAEEDRTERAEGRAERFEDRAGRAVAASDARRAASDRISDGIPFGQPILVGHHSEGRARRDVERMHSHMRKSIEEGDRARYWAGRSVAADHYEEHRKDPGRTLRRIAKLEAEERSRQRRQGQLVARATKKLVDGELDPEALVDALAANDLDLLDLADELGYWRKVVADAEAEGFKVWGPRDFVPGDYVCYTGTWHQVARVNPKSLSIAWNLRLAPLKVMTVADATQHGRVGTHTADYTQIKGRCPEAAMAEFLASGKVPGLKSAREASAARPASALREAEAAKPKAPKKRADPKVPKRVKVECRWDSTEATLSWLDGRGRPHGAHEPVTIEAPAGAKYTGSVWSDGLLAQVTAVLAEHGYRHRGSWSGSPGQGIVCAIEPVPGEGPVPDQLEPVPAEPETQPVDEPLPAPEKAPDLRICGNFFAQTGFAKLAFGNDLGVTKHHPTRKARAMTDAPRYADWFQALLDENRPLDMSLEEFESSAYSGHVSYELGGTDGHYAPEPLEAWVLTFRRRPVGALYWGNDRRTELAPYANAYAAAVDAAQPALAARPGEGRDDLVPLHCSHCDEGGPLRARERGDFGCDSCEKPVNMSTLALSPGDDWAVRADGLLCHVPTSEPTAVEPAPTPETVEEPPAPAPDTKAATKKAPAKKAAARTPKKAAASKPAAPRKPRATKKAAAPAAPNPAPVEQVEKAEPVEPTKVQKRREVLAEKVEAHGCEVRETHKLIPIEEIERDESQPREEFDPVKLQELADSMAKLGQLQPITVRRVGVRRYAIVVGERRWRAAQLAGLAKMKTIVRTGGEYEAGKTLAEQVAENAARADMTPMEEARGFKRLVDQHGYEPAEVAKMVGKSPQYVGWRIDLLKLSDAAQDALSKGHLPVGLSWYVAQLSADNQSRFLAKWARGEFKTVRDAEAFAQAARTEEARQEQQGSFFVLADAAPRPEKNKQGELLPGGAHLPESERERIQNDRRKLVGKVDSMSGAGQVLADLATADPEELALLLAGTPGGVGGYSLRLKHLADVISKAQANMRKAEAIAAVREGSTIQINPELAAA
ncbi:ParB/RepB/Spo0J family partition protein [Kitasatospora aureofaciens]|uniref:ParB/RepB/Spo0J family partition protein n=1 Tax=Kitasatospora aureofaciens TaxID=1894 RepID=UPI0034021BBD